MAGGAAEYAPGSPVALATRLITVPRTSEISACRY